MSSMTKSNNTKARLAYQLGKKISYQFPDSPEGRLWAAVVRQAIQDLCGRTNIARNHAVRYLFGRVIVAEMCGVDPDWIRSQVKKAGLLG